MELDDSKKNVLREYFREAVRARLADDEARLGRAMDKARASGVSTQELEWAEGLDSEDIIEVFGEDTFNEDLQYRMMQSDIIDEAFGEPGRFVGLYPNLSR